MAVLLAAGAAISAVTGAGTAPFNIKAYDWPCLICTYSGCVQGGACAPRDVLQ